MPQAANIVLADAQATPVNHTFVPIGPDKNNVFWFEDQSAASAIGYWKVSVSFKKPNAADAGKSSNGRTYRIEIGLHEPVLEVLSNSTVSGIIPAPTVSYIPRMLMSYVMPVRSALIDRKNLRKMASALLADTQVVSILENLQNVW